MKRISPKTVIFPMKVYLDMHAYLLSLDFQFVIPSYCFQAVMDGAQSDALGGLCRLLPLSVVLYVDIQFSILFIQLNVDEACMSMFQHIADCFLQDAVNLISDIF